jgi:hypothetical protein
MKKKNNPQTLADLLNSKMADAYLNENQEPTPGTDAQPEYYDVNALPEKLTCKDYRGIFTISREEYNLNGTDIAEITTNYPVELQKKFGEEICKRYNQYPELEARNRELVEALRNLVDRDLIKDKDGDHYEEVTALLSNLKK